MPKISDDNDAKQWYVLKGKRVVGVYSSNEVAEFLLIGRVRNSDRVSVDGVFWEQVTQVPQLIPDALSDLHDLRRWLPGIFPRGEAEK